MKTNYLRRLVERVTCARQCLNDTFTYYGHRVTLRSCMRAFVVVTVHTADSEQSPALTEFDFDFYTHKLHFDHSAHLAVTTAIVEAFDERYDRVQVHYPLPKKAI